MVYFWKSPKGSGRTESLTKALEALGELCRCPATSLKWRAVNHAEWTVRNSENQVVGIIWIDSRVCLG